MKVLGVSQHNRKPDWRQVNLLDEASGKAVTAVCFGRQADDLKLNEPLPEGWTIEQGQYGPILRYPKAGGGRGGGMAASWRNTEEGFKYEQSRMDKRTALMQAVQMGSSNLGVVSVGGKPAEGSAAAAITELADQLYAWLRKE